MGTLDGTLTLGGLAEASDGKLYGMTTSAGFFSYGTIFRIAKDGSDFNVIFRFNDNDPVKSGYNPRGDLVQGTDGYLYGTLSSGGENGKGVLFKIQLDGSNFTRIINFDGAAKGATPGASLLIGSDGKIYGLTQAGGSNNQGSLFAVDNSGVNFTRLFDFDGNNTGGNTLSKLTEGSDGLLYGMANTGGANALGTIFKIRKNGTGFQKLTDLSSSAAQPVFGPLVETQPGKFFGMTANGGAGNGGTLFSIASNGTFSVVKDFPQEESNPSKLIRDHSGEFNYGVTQSGKPSIFRITDSGKYERIFDLPSGAVIEHLFLFSTGHLWCTGTKDGEPYVFRINTDGTEFALLPEITDNIPSQRNIEWLTEKPDGTILGITTRGTVDNPGMIFSIQNDGTGFQALGFMPSGIEFHSSVYLQGSDGFVYAIATYNHALYRYDGGSPASMKRIVTLPDEIGQVPMKLIELNGGRIGVAMRSGQIFSVEKDGSKFIKMIDQTSERGLSPADMVQTFDGWIYVSASMGGTYNKGVVYKMRSNGSSYTAIHNFNGEDGDTPNNIIFKLQQHTITFDPIGARKFTNIAFKPIATSSSGSRIQFTSSNPDVAVIEDGKIKSVGVGTTIITASIPANTNYYATTPIERELVIEKGVQTISFTNPGDKVFGDAQFELTASTGSGLPVAFEPTSKNITVSDTKVTPISAGIASIKATQNGDAFYDPAEPVEISFCVNPPTPSITTSGAVPNMVLTSSNNEGNQWYRNNEVINNATQAVFSPSESGTYTVITVVESCSSAESDSYELVITGISHDTEFTVDVFPNPVKDLIHVQLKGYEGRNVTVEVLDTFGRILSAEKAQGLQVMLDATTYANGLYIIQVISGKSIVTRKIIKD